MAEIKSHTSLRGVAALLVMFIHFHGYLSEVIDLEKHTEFFVRGHVWVDLFFILSGFILYHVYNLRPGIDGTQAANFLKARFARIYPLHIATLLFLLVTQFILVPWVKEVPRDINWYSFLLNVLGIHAWGFVDDFDWNFPSWSLSVEFAAYLAFIPFCWAMRKSPRIAIASVIAWMAAWMIYHHLNDAREGWERTVLFRGLPMFLTGACLYRLRNAAVELSDAMMSGLQVVSILAIVSTLHFDGGDELLIPSFVVLVFSTQTDKGLFARFVTGSWFQRLGQMSYSIYMLHMPVLYVIKFLLSQSLGSAGIAITAFAATLLVSHLSYDYFETPLRNYIGGRRRTLAPATA